MALQGNSGFFPTTDFPACLSIHANKRKVYDAHSLSVVTQVEASLVFVTSVVFNGDNTAVVSVGGDANCLVQELAPRGGGTRCAAFLIELCAVSSGP